jgi:tetratricopeptide (TPR) repeat protein
MAKTPSNKLFHLIKSLSGAEKRYFKVYVSSKDPLNNKYIRLFDAIDRQPVFDEEELIKAVYGSEKVESRKYSELKAYLYELVVRSLQSYDEKSSTDYRLKNLLLGVRTLFRRALYEDSKEMLSKAKKLATSLEDFNTLVEVLNWEKRIAYAQTDIDFLDRELERITKEEQDCLEEMQVISTYRNIFFKILVSLRKDMSRKEQQSQDLKTLMEHPLMKSETLIKSKTAKVLFYRAYSLYHLFLSDFSSFYGMSKNLIQLMESNKLTLNEDVSDYISALNNHVISCGRVGRINELKETLEKLKKVTPITSDDALKIHRQYYLGKFRLCINSGAFEEGLEALKLHLNEVEKFDQKQFIKNNFYLQYFCIYFGSGNFQSALDSLNEWLKLSGSVERKDLQSLARILNLIIHYELGNTILLESLIRSTYRYLTKDNRLSEFERKIINFIREAGKPHSKKEMRKVLETLKNDFEYLSKSPSYGIFGLFDLMSWFESKISGRPFAEVVQEQFKQEIAKSST